MSRELEHILEQLKESSREDEETSLSAAEQQRIFQMTMKKIKQEQKDTKPVHKKTASRVGRRVAAAAAIVIALSVGSVGTAAILHFNLDNKFARFFGASRDEGAEKEVQVQNLKMASQEIDHIKVTADQVIGDEHSLYIMYHLSGVSPDNSDFEFKDIDIKVDSNDFVVGTPVCSGYEGDDPYYILEVHTSSNLVGKPISMKLGAIGYRDLDDKFVPITKGGYHLTWQLDYKVQTKDIEINKDINIYGGTAKLHRISVSPLSVTVYLSDVKNTNRETTEPNDRLRVVKKNGTIYDSERMETGSVLNDYDTICLGLHEIVKYSDIQEIQFAGLTIPLNANPNAEKEYLYENDKMGITVSLPETLYKVLAPGKTKTHTDEYTKNKIDEVHFIGKINDTKLDVFTISRVHKVYSPDELELLNPLARYIMCENGYTYYMQVTEEVPEKEVDAFANIINNYVAKLEPRINIK